MKIIKYFICLIVFTVFLFFKFFIDKLQYIGQSSEWFSSRDLLPWQGRKAMEIYNKEHNEKIEKQLRQINGDGK